MKNSLLLFGVLLAGIPISLHYGLSKRIRINAGLQADFLLASRSQFRTQQGFATESNTSGYSAFVSPNISGLGGIDFRLRAGLWLSMQYQAGLRPLQLQRTVEPLIEYDFNGPGLRRQHFQVGLVVFLLHFEDSGQMRGIWFSGQTVISNQSRYGITALRSPG
jgi:hypothetical protein